MSEIKVNSIKGVAATTAALTINNTDGTCTANLTNRTNKNLIINGAMQVAQRGTSSTATTGGYYTVDRFTYSIGGHDEAATHAQVDVASGTSPYQSGFRKAYKITNGNQTSGAGSSDYIQINYYVEAQDIANSGWDVTNSSSNLTFSFWIKSSVSQFFTFAIRCKDGTEQVINFKTPVLSADTWTKVTKTIPGNSNLTVNNDNGQGFQIMFFPFIGTDYSTVGLAEDTWSAWASAKHALPNTSTWWTTNDATWEITGVQLEVSDHATDFEHRSFAVEKRLCQRYYEQYDHNDTYWLCSGVYNASTEAIFPFDYQAEKRTAPTITMQDSVNTILMRPNTSNAQGGTLSALNIKTRKCAFKSTSNPSSSSGGYATTMSIYNSGSGSTVLSIDSEL